MDTIATPQLWGITIALTLGLFLLDFIITRRPHEVSMKEASAWSIFYIALPVAFGGWLWTQHGSKIGGEFFTGYIVEKSLSVDNLFIFMLILSGFAVPKLLQQRVLLIGIAGALVMRAIMIAVGASLLSRFAVMFLIFGLVLLWTAVKVLRDTRSDEEEEINPGDMRVVKFIRRFYDVTDDYRGTKMMVSEKDASGRARRMLTPLAVVTLAVLATDAVFAIDSVPAVYGITGDPYLVFVTNAFALMGLRALYFLVSGVLDKLVHLGYGLALILAFIGYKLIAHWAHDIWHWVPTPSTAFSLLFIVITLVVVTVTSLTIGKDDKSSHHLHEPRNEHEAHGKDAVAHRKVN